MVAGGRRVAGRRIYANPREIWNLERLARHRAAKLGYRVRRSRRRKGRDNAGEFMLIHKASSTVPFRYVCQSVISSFPSGRFRFYYG